MSKINLLKRWFECTLKQSRISFEFFEVVISKILGSDLRILSWVMTSTLYKSFFVDDPAFEQLTFPNVAVVTFFFLFSVVCMLKVKIFADASLFEQQLSGQSNV